jgi:hypothetical protein
MIKYTVNKFGTKFWYLDGKLHRPDAPAIQYTDGSTEWWLNGELHREDGPACEYTDGDKYWFINDHRLSEAEFNAHQILYSNKVTETN